MNELIAHSPSGHLRPEPGFPSDIAVCLHMVLMTQSFTQAGVLCWLKIFQFDPVTPRISVFMVCPNHMGALQKQRPKPKSHPPRLINCSFPVCRQCGETLRRTLLPMTCCLRTRTHGLWSPWQEAKLKIPDLNEQKGNCICYLEGFISCSVQPFLFFPHQLVHSHLRIFRRKERPESIG